MHKNRFSIIQHHNSIVDSHMMDSETDQIFNTMGNGVRIIDKDFNMMRANTAFLGLAGITMDESHGKKCYEVFCGPKCHTSECSMKKILGGKEQIKCDVEKVHLDGLKVPCVLTAAPLRNPKGEIFAIIEDFKDKRQLIQMELDLLKIKTEFQFQLEDRTQALNNIIQRMQKELSKRKRTEEVRKEEKQIMTVVDASRICGVTRGTVWKWIKDGRFAASTTAGGHYRILESDFYTFLKKKEMTVKFQNQKKTRILIVSDNLSIHKVFKRSLPGKNFDLAYASNEFHSGFKVIDFKPNIIFFDLFMPKMDGFEFCRTIKNDKALSQIKMIAIADIDDNTKEGKILDLGADAIFKKPFCEKDLLEKIAF